VSCKSNYAYDYELPLILHNDECFALHDLYKDDTGNEGAHRETDQRVVDPVDEDQTFQGGSGLASVSVV
jgi:hypothetical protein